MVILAAVAYGLSALFGVLGLILGAREVRTVLTALGEHEAAAPSPLSGEYAASWAQVTTTGPLLASAMAGSRRGRRHAFWLLVGAFVFGTLGNFLSLFS